MKALARIFTILVISSLLVSGCGAATASIPTVVSPTRPAPTSAPLATATSIPTAVQPTEPAPTLSSSPSAAPSPVPAEVFKLGIRGSDLKAFEGSLWLEDHASTNRVYRIDPSEVTVTGEFDAGRPCSIAVGLGSVWVADLDGGRLLQVDPATAEVSRAIDGFPMACDPVVGNDAVWMPIRGGITRYNPATGSVDVIEVQGGAGIAVLDDSVWLTPFGGNAVQEVHASTFETIRSIMIQDRLPPYPMNPLAAKGILLLANEDAGTITRIDADRGEVDWRIETDPPARLEIAFGSLWSTSYLKGTITRIDLESGVILAIGTAGGNPNGIAALNGYIWVIDTSSGDLRRIDPAAFDSSSATTP